MTGPGRPRDLDHVKCREICALVAAGCGLEGAAKYVGCSVSTIRRELLANDEFRQQFDASEVQMQLDPLRAMRRAAATHWRAAAWLLERTHPQRFCRPAPVAVKADELGRALKAAIDRAADEIEDPELRFRICENLLAAAKDASPTLKEAESKRRQPPDEDRELAVFLASAERDRRESLRSLAEKLQNAVDSARRRQLETSANAASVESASRQN